MMKVMLAAALAVASVSPLASANEAPEITSDPTGLTFNMPVDTDVNVVRRQTISVGDLATNVAALQVAVDALQLNSAQYLGAQVIISNVLNQTAEYARQQGAMQATIQSLMDRLEAAEERVTASELRTAQLIADAQRNMNTTLESFMEDSTEQQEIAIAQAGEIAQEVANKTEMLAHCALQGQGYNYTNGTCAVPTAVVIGSTAGATVPAQCATEGSVTYDQSSNSLKVCDGARYTSVVAQQDMTARMYQNHFASSKSQDSGYISDRVLNFVKHSDDTYIQVDYVDNFRVHGTTYCYANWNVMICNPDGNGCEECTSPGKLNLHRYSHQQHNYWMNDHYGSMMTGICRRRGNRNLTAGRYRLRVMINNNRCDIHTGHGGQVGSLSVIEVTKAG